jgi:DNA replication protein DnaC
LCTEPRLPGIAAQHGVITREAARKELTFTDYLERVLKVEAEADQQKSRQMLMRTARFPAIKTLEEYRDRCSPEADPGAYFPLLHRAAR